jgi:hypothetical protein
MGGYWAGMESLVGYAQNGDAGGGSRKWPITFIEI